MIIGASGAKPSRTADLERKLVHHCSPALAGLKPANMIVYREGIDADAGHLCNISFGPARGIVRQERITDPKGFQAAQKRQRRREQFFPSVNCAVHIHHDMAES